MAQLTTISTQDLLSKQRQFLATGQTQDVSFRIRQLRRLRQAVTANQEKIVAALKADLHKPIFESYLGEILSVHEIDYALRHIRSWAKSKPVSLPWEQLPGSAQIYPEPLGVVLIISPWNYPFQLAIAPLVGAIAAGNCTIIKPSEISSHTSRAIAQLIESAFEPDYIAVVEGGVEVSQALLTERFDHIFFTGGNQVGKIIMAAAAQHLTPVTLELGGKSPCIVDADAALDKAARRIAWGKFMNAGQTCVAPDYLLVEQTIKSDLLIALKSTLQHFYGDDPAQSPDYARIISDKHYQRLVDLLDKGEITLGGQTNPEERYIAPTVIEGVSWADPVMQEEIFGPILPVIEYSSLDQAIAMVNQRPKPLALYFFSENKERQAKVLRETSSGGMCINETVMHLGVSSLPFGGVGDSGMGAYHGKTGFDTFSHHKSVLRKPFWLEFPIRYPPYQGKLGLLKKIIFGLTEG